MRTVLPWLLIVLAAVLGYWLFAGPSDPRPADYDAVDPGEGDPSGTGDVGAGLRGAAKAEGGTAGARPKKAWQPPDPRTLPTGSLRVQPLGPDLQPLMQRGLSIIVTPKGQRRARLGHFSEEDGSWRFDRVIAGEVSIRVRGDHVVGQTVTAVVQRDRETLAQVHLEHAGAVRYDVNTYAKTRPPQVLVELFDQAGRPTEAWFQVRTSRSMTQPMLKKAHTLGPEGVLFGLRPGTYRVKATNVETDEWDDGEVTVEAGKTAALSLTVRR